MRVVPVGYHRASTESASSPSESQPPAARPALHTSARWLDRFVYPARIHPALTTVASVISTVPTVAAIRSCGQSKILAYTVTTAIGTVRGCHFVLLQGGDVNQISFVNPGKPTKDYTFIIDCRGDSSGPKRQVFFHSPVGFDNSNQTYELNTIFTIRLIDEQPGASKKEEISVNGLNEKIDQLAILLREQGDLKTHCSGYEGVQQLRGPDDAATLKYPTTPDGRYFVHNQAKLTGSVQDQTEESSRFNSMIPENASVVRTHFSTGFGRLGVFSLPDLRL